MSSDHSRSPPKRPKTAWGRNSNTTRRQPKRKQQNNKKEKTVESHVDDLHIEYCNDNNDVQDSLGSIAISHATIEPESYVVTQKGKTFSVVERLDRPFSNKKEQLKNDLNGIQKTNLSNFHPKSKPSQRKRKRNATNPLDEAKELQSQTSSVTQAFRKRGKAARVLNKPTISQPPKLKKFPQKQSSALNSNVQDLTQSPDQENPVSCRHGEKKGKNLGKFLVNVSEHLRHNKCDPCKVAGGVTNNEPISQPQPKPKEGPQTPAPTAASNVQDLTQSPDQENSVPHKHEAKKGNQLTSSLRKGKYSKEFTPYMVKWKAYHGKQAEPEVEKQTCNVADSMVFGSQEIATEEVQHLLHNVMDTCLQPHDDSHNMLRSKPAEDGKSQDCVNFCDGSGSDTENELIKRNEETTVDISKQNKSMTTPPKKQRQQKPSSLSQQSPPSSNGSSFPEGFSQSTQDSLICNQSASSASTSPSSTSESSANTTVSSTIDSHSKLSSSASPTGPSPAERSTNTATSAHNSRTNLTTTPKESPSGKSTNSAISTHDSCSSNSASPENSPSGKSTSSEISTNASLATSSTSVSEKATASPDGKSTDTAISCMDTEIPKATEKVSTSKYFASIDGKAKQKDQSASIDDILSCIEDIDDEPYVGDCKAKTKTLHPGADIDSIYAKPLNLIPTPEKDSDTAKTGKSNTDSIFGKAQQCVANKAGSAFSLTKQNNPDVTPVKRQAVFGKSAIPRKKRKNATKIQIGATIIDKPDDQCTEMPSIMEGATPESDHPKTGESGPKTGKFRDSPTEKSPIDSRLSKTKTQRKQQVATRKAKPTETIEIESSDSESEMSPAEKSRPQDTDRVDVVRIAIGKKIFVSDCNISFQEPSYLEITYSKPKGITLALKDKDVLERHRINMISDVIELKFYVEKPKAQNEKVEDVEENVSDEIDCFIALKVKKTEDNNLSKYKNFYQPDGKDPERRFIVVEFRCGAALEDLQRMMAAAEGDFFKEENKLSRAEMEDFCVPLVKSDADDFKRRKNSLKSCARSTSKFLAGKKDTDTLLVYPFDGDRNAIEKTASGLTEARDWQSSVTFADTRKCSDETDDEDNKSITESEPKSQINSSAAEGESEKEGMSYRAHFLEIRVQDFARLEPRQFLNDTLIDFWFQWIWRNDDKNDVHLFSSHFYTTLCKEGTQGVSKWTKKKGIDIFKKKFIFIPINKSLHWSLCVVVNPGEIKNATSDVSLEEPHPFMLFFDSLKLHHQKTVGNKVREWLNSEWTRLGKSASPDLKETFQKENMPIESFKVPYQKNSWDCGVFVCRYGYGMYLLRKVRFTRRDYISLESNIKKSEAFDFNLRDIKRMREEIITLIENLSHIYLEWKRGKEEEEKLAKKAKRAEKLLAQQQSQHSDPASLKRDDQGTQTKSNASLHSDFKDGEESTEPSKRQPLKDIMQMSSTASDDKTQIIFEKDVTKDSRFRQNLSEIGPEVGKLCSKEHDVSLAQEGEAPETGSLTGEKKESEQTSSFANDSNLKPVGHAECSENEDDSIAKTSYDLSESSNVASSQKNSTSPAIEKRQIQSIAIDEGNHDAISQAVTIDLTENLTKMKLNSINHADHNAKSVSVPQLGKEDSVSLQSPSVSAQAPGASRTPSPHNEFSNATTSDVVQPKLLNTLIKCTDDRSPTENCGKFLEEDTFNNLRNKSSSEECFLLGESEEV